MSARQGLNSSRRWTSAVSGIEEASSSNASVCRLVHRHESCIAATQRFSLQSEISKNFSGNLEPMTELYFAARRCKQDLLHILYESTVWEKPSTSRRWLILYAHREVVGRRGVESVQLHRVSQPSWKASPSSLSQINVKKCARDRYVMLFILAMSLWLTLWQTVPAFSSLVS